MATWNGCFGLLGVVIGATIGFGGPGEPKPAEPDVLTAVVIEVRDAMLNHFTVPLGPGEIRD